MGKFNYTTTILYFSYFMVVVYILVGLFLLTHKQITYLEATQKNSLGILCLVYGLYRGYRIYKQLKKINNESDS